MIFFHSKTAAERIGRKNGFIREIDGGITLAVHFVLSITLPFKRNFKDFDMCERRHISITDRPNYWIRLTWRSRLCGDWVGRFPDNIDFARGVTANSKV